MKRIAVIGAGIVGICNAFFLQKSGFKVTVFDKESPGSMTSYGHACTFADYANVPVNSPSLFRELPSMLFRSDGPLTVDIFYIIKNFPWVFKFLMNCREDKVKEISESLANLLHNSRLSYDDIFKEVNLLLGNQDYQGCMIVLKDIINNNKGNINAAKAEYMIAEIFLNEK